MTCKDCIHCDVCYLLRHYGTDADYVDCYKFKDKSRIVELPCKVGDILYYPWVYDGASGIATLKVSSLQMDMGGRVIIFIKDPESDMPIQSYFLEEDFDKEVFLTPEKAGEALKKEREK